MRVALTHLSRTPEERADEALSWRRPDLNFLAAGACHVLAFAFLERFPAAGFRPRLIRPAPGHGGSHVYVSDGVLAFDAQGYIPEQDLLAGHWSAYRDRNAAWTADVVDVDRPLAHLCAAEGMRPPWHFPGDVWGRALNYLTSFPAPPSRA